MKSWYGAVTVALAGALGALMIAATPAHAGSCEGDELAAVREFETFAAKGRPTPQSDEICLEAIQFERKLAARFIKACEKIVTRTPVYQPCVLWSVRYGARTLGALELFAAVGQHFPIAPFTYQDPAVELYAKLADPRAAPLVLAAWQAALADPRATSKKRNVAHVWGVWRRQAVELFGAHGGVAERDFLKTQLAVTTARGLKRAMTKAIAAIDRRLASAKP